MRTLRTFRRQARTGAGWGALVLLVVGALAVPAAQQPAPRPKSRPAFASQPREEWQMPARVMDEIGVRPGMTVADVGAGEGWFTFYLAERVGPSGRVIAEDIDAERLEAARERCAMEKVSNVSVVVGEAEDAKLPAGGVDVALMVNVLSAMHNSKGLLLNLAKGLKPEGRLVVIEWNPAKWGEATKEEEEEIFRVTRRQMEDGDFDVLERLDFLPAQTIWICQRRDRR